MLDASYYEIEQDVVKELSKRIDTPKIQQSRRGDKSVSFITNLDHQVLEAYDGKQIVIPIDRHVNSPGTKIENQLLELSINVDETIDQSSIDKTEIDLHESI